MSTMQLDSRIKLNVELSGLETTVLEQAQAQYPHVPLTAENTIVDIKVTRNKGEKQGLGAELSYYPVNIPANKAHLTVAAKLAGVAAPEGVESEEAEVETEVVADTTEATEDTASKEDEDMFA